VLIPTPLFCERVVGRRVEECAEVVVPIGGGVGVYVEVNEEGIGILDREEGKVEAHVRGVVRDYLRWVREVQATYKFWLINHTELPVAWSNIYLNKQLATTEPRR
jgi:hypothetical protein